MSTRILVVIALLVVGVCGCPQQRFSVELRSEPSGANIDVISDEVAPGQSFRLPRQTPVAYQFDFARSGARYEVIATKEEFEEERRELTLAAVRELPTEDGQRVLTIPMQRAPFQDIEKAEVVVDPEEGLTIKYRRVRAFREDIERQGVSVSRVHGLAEGRSFGGLAISPQGGRLAFSVYERAQDEAGLEIEYSNIRCVSTSGAGVTQMTTGRWLDVDPAFSQDGRFLYLASNRLRNGGLDLFRISSETTGGGVAVIHRQNEGWGRHPSEATTGLMAFSYLPTYARVSGIAHVWTLGGPNQYPTQLREGTSPSVSPDGGTIAFVGPDQKIWLVSTRAAAPIQLTANPETAESDPAWSPDGQYIVYVSNEGKDNTGTPNNDIWIMRADGTAQTQLTTNGSDDITPVVDPESRWIYFVSNRGFRWGIWRMPWPTGLER